MYGTVVMEG
jgi:hypothetical protein